MTAVAVGDALLAVLPAIPDTEVDDTLAEPAKALAGRVYVWPRRTAPQRIDDDPAGRFVESALRIRILVCLGAKGEVRAIARNRDTTVALDDAVDAIHTAIHENRRGLFWWDAYVEQTNYQAITTDEVRAAAVDVVLRLDTDNPAIFGGSGA